MSEINKFNFYRNYFEAIRYLKNKDRLLLYDAIFEYVFEDKEPILNGLTKGIWSNISIPLKTSKEGILNGKKGGAPIGNGNAKKTTPNTTPKQPPLGSQKQPNKNISTFLFLLSNFSFNNISNNNELKEEIKEWLEYKEKRKEIYTEIGLKKLLVQIDKRCTQYGISNVIEIIDDSMANCYQGIIFDKLKNQKSIQNKSQESLPEWVDKDLENEPMTEAEKKELDEILKSIGG